MTTSRFRAIRRTAGLACLLVAVALPFAELGRIDRPFAVEVIILGIAATGLNLMFGYTGMLSLGHGAYLGIGAYSLGLAVSEWNWAPEVALPLAVVAGAVSSAIVGLLFVRLSGFYFSVATLGLAVALEGLVRAYPAVTGGASGLTIGRRLDLGVAVIETDTEWYVFAGAVAAVIVGLVWWTVSGRTGRLLRLVHSDPLAAAVYGVDVLRTRLVVFVVSGTVTSFAGALLFLWRGVFVPESGGLIQSVELVGLTVVGGAGYVVGGLVGSFSLKWIQALVSDLGDFEQLTYGITFLLVVFYLRSGVAGAIDDLFSWAVKRRTAPIEEPRAATAVPVSALTGRIGARDRMPANPGAWDDWSGASGLLVDHTTRRFGGVVAVDEATLVAPVSAITALIGANGAGKSTLLNLISGIEAPDGGRILLDGADLSAVTPAERARRGIVRTFQVPRLVDQLTVAENVALNRDAMAASAFSKTGSRESIHEARAALDAAGLGALAERRAHALGTGERKFVELVRALMVDPSVLLMDEPAVGLSTAEIARLRDWLLQLRESGTAVVLVDHNLDFVGDVADFVYEMVNGVIVSGIAAHQYGRQDPVPEGRG